jgi:hypothetical protein
MQKLKILKVVLSALLSQKTLEGFLSLTDAKVGSHLVCPV